MADEGEVEVSAGSFRCAECGVCCRTQKVVLLTLADIFRIAERTGTTPGAFYKRYCLRSDRLNDRGLARIYLKTEGGCPFLKGRQCSIHAFKPIVCSLSPFYYPAASLATLAVMGVLVPGCVIGQHPYGTMARGDEKRCVDMELEVGATDAYVARYGRFDERTARIALDQLQSTLADEAVRAVTLHRLLDESMRREDYYRNDPYYRGSMQLHLSGFYGEFREEAGRMASSYPGIHVFEPAAVGAAGGDLVVVLQPGDFKTAKQRLEGKPGSVSVKASVRAGIEFGTVTIAAGGTPLAFFYIHLEEGLKKTLKSRDGRMAVTFLNDKKGRFTFEGNDVCGWLR